MRPAVLVRVTLAVLALLWVLGAASSSQADIFRDKDWYTLLNDFHAILYPPKGRELSDDDKVIALLNVADRARRMAHSSNGVEQTKGTPPIPPGMAGVDPDHGYVPRLVDLFARWLAAGMTSNPQQKSDRYRDALLAIPLNYKDYPIYRHPSVFALIVDARFQCGDDPDKALSEWIELQQGAKLSALLECRKPIKLSYYDSYFPSKEVEQAAKEIKGHISQEMVQEAALTLEPNLIAEKGQVPRIAGNYDGTAPVAVWAEDGKTGKIISERHVLAPHESFRIALNNIGDGESGEAVIFWGPPDEKKAAFLGIPVKNKWSSWSCQYQSTSYQHTVDFNPLRTTASVWVTDADGKNRDDIKIGYTYDTKLKTFDWKLVDKNNESKVIMSVTESNPNGVIMIPKGTLSRGGYKLLVRNDPNNPDPAINQAYADVNFDFSLSGPGVALIIGIDSYFSAGDCLHRACDDAQAIIDSLKAAGYTDDDIVWVRGEHLPKERLNTSIKDKDLSGYRRVTSRVLKRALARLRTLVKDRRPKHVLFFYSGHGQSRLENGAWSDELVAATQAGESAEDMKPVYLHQVTEIADSLDTQAGKPTFTVLMDACRSQVGAMGDDSNQVSDLRINGSTQGANGAIVVPIYSCSLGEKSNEGLEPPYDVKYNGETVAHGFFTYSLLQGIKASTVPTLESILSNAVPVMSTLVAQATEVNVKAKGPEGTGTEAYSKSQTMMLGKIVLTSPDAVKQAIEEERKVSLF